MDEIRKLQSTEAPERLVPRVAFARLVQDTMTKILKERYGDRALAPPVLCQDGPPNPPPGIGFRPPPGLADTGTTIPGSRFWPEQMMQAPEEEDLGLRLKGPDGHALDYKQILAFTAHNEPLEKEQGSPSETSSNSVTQKIINSGAGIMAKAKTLWPRGQSLPRWTSTSSSGTTGYPRNAPPSHGKETLGTGLRSPRRRWYAVWCHERSHKSDTSPLRSQLQSVLGRHNAELVCQKTSCKFKLWVNKMVAWKAEEENWQDQLDEICRSAVSKTTEQQAAQVAAAPAVVAEAGAWVGDRNSPENCGHRLGPL
eukprot:s1309_g8.t1